MKHLRIAAFLFSLLLVGICCNIAAAGEAMPTEVMYEAKANVNFNIRSKPDTDSKKIEYVGKGELVFVYRIDDEWSIVSQNKVQGYCKTEWLWLFRAVHFDAPPVPGYYVQQGIGRITESCFAAVDGYEGNTFVPGNLFTVYKQGSETAEINMMRSTTELPSANFTFSPFVPWREAEVENIIGGFTTYYNEHTGGKKMSESRAFNIEHGCNLINETVVAPGAQFSFNDVCGPYLTKNGYVLGPNISSDGVGYGGGICQMTTTLYNALLGLPVQIDEWLLHRTSGVAYVPQFFDAVVGIYNDFTFTNTLPYPISIHALPQNGVLTVLILRAEE